MFFCLFVRENACFSVAGKEKGVLYDSDKYDKCYKSGIASNNHSFYGSFCSTVRGTYEFKIIGKQTLFAKKFGNFDVAYWKKEDIGRCLGDDLETTKSFYLDPNTCYPFQVQMGYWCYFRYSHLEFQVKFPGSSSFVHVGSDNAIRDSSYFDCVDGWYGSDCSRASSETYCNGNGYVNEKHSGDGYCTCNNYSSPFCEDPNQVYHTEKPMICQIPIDNKGCETYIMRMEQNPCVISDITHSLINISGKIFLPQHGKYAFKVKATNPVMLMVGSKASGSYGNYEDIIFDCKNKECDNEAEISNNAYNRGDVSFQIMFYGDCSTFELQWKNYRYHRDDANTPWEAIPMRFIGGSPCLLCNQTKAKDITPVHSSAYFPRSYMYVLV